VYRALAKGIVELFAVALARTPRVEVHVDAAAERAIDAALARGPVVVLASHTGNWELAAAGAAKLFARRGRGFWVVAKRQSVRTVDRFVRGLRRKLGIGLIDPAGALGTARAALARGDVVALPIDQVPERAAHAVTVPFLGAPALVDRAPATLAFRARATLLVFAAERDAKGRHRVHLLGEHRPGPTRSWIVEATFAVTAQLEAFVRAHPTQWLWFHRRWRLVPRRSAGYARRQPWRSLSSSRSLASPSRRASS